MAVLKCVECGHSAQTETEGPKTCPMCDGNMVAVKPKAAPAAATANARPKAKAAEEDEKPKAKAKPKPADDDEEDEQPRTKAKAKPRAADDDEDEEEEKPKPRKARAKAESLDDEDDQDDESLRDGKAARRLGLESGFDDPQLMKQVETELKSGEVLHWAGRQSLPVIKKHALMQAIGGLVFILVAVGVLVFMLSPASKKMNLPDFMLAVPCLFMLVGLGIATLGPWLKLRQAKLGWYALTDQRAIVFHVYPIGRSGVATTYTPDKLRKVGLMRTMWKKGAGCLVFRIKVTRTTTYSTNRRTGHTSSNTSTSITYYGFLWIDEHEDVLSLLREVLFGSKKESDEDEEE